MSEDSKPGENLTEEFRNLGKNLTDVLRTVLEHPERKRLQEEITTGVTELGAVLKREADSFSESSTGQRLKSDISDLSERLRTSEAQEKVRRELLTAMQIVNQELQKVVNHWSEAQTSTEEESEAQQESGADEGEQAS